MQRPVMNPNFALESPVPSTSGLRKRLAPVGRMLRVVGGVLFLNPFGKRVQFRNEEGTRLSRFLRGLTYRLAFVPLVLVAFLAALIFGATHPGRAPGSADPMTLGVYYDPVNFVSDDGARLEGWLVPVLDAKRVIEQKESVIGKRHPAVVLVHDFAASRQQLLPLVEPLHNAGYVVLAVNLRGASSQSTDAQTFGIREASDVKAAVEMLRRRAYVDPTRIGLIGVGTGANASIIAARNDPAIAALVLSAPVESFDQAIANRIGRDRRWLPAARPLLRWTFQVMYGVETSDLDITKYNALLASRAIHMTDGRHGLLEKKSVDGMQTFLRKHLADEAVVTTTAN